MKKFIEVDNNIIDIQDIRRIEFISDDIGINDFPRDNKGKIAVDFIVFTFAKIYTFAGECFEVNIDLYPPEEEIEAFNCDDDEIVEGWYRQNHYYIGKMWKTLKEQVSITKITNIEYEE